MSLSTFTHRSMSTLTTHLLDRQKSSWQVVLTSGRLISERELTFDLAWGGLRPRDWTLDLVSTGDVRKIKELWLLCPPDEHGPRTAMLPILEPGTAFQFKVKSVDTWGAWGTRHELQVIGRIENKEEGDCVCFLYDTRADSMSTPYYTNIRAFRPPRDSLATIYGFNHDILGLSL